MIYHPDKNEGSEEANNKFREITEAYDTLSNYMLKRNYDRGLFAGKGRGPTAPEEVYRPAGSWSEGHDSGQDPEKDKDYTAFYRKQRQEAQERAKQRATMPDNPPPSVGQTSSFDVDEFYQSHYTKARVRQRNAQQSRERQKEWEDTYREKEETGNMMLVVIILGFMGFLLSDGAYVPKSFEQYKKPTSSSSPGTGDPNSTSSPESSPSDQKREATQEGVKS
jgi:curved DNA-binding protein CbpA